ncbi:MAG TPA: DUF5127 domain-containing protein, partial [Spirochaetia bacterium]|nr:DUF5127 domain-containing protein [Spirochaetia bacterium]
MTNQFRPPAVPLVTVDPFFSIWSCADELHQDKTRHWTLVPHELVGLIRVDDRVLRFLGSTNDGPAWRNAKQPSGMHQTEILVKPTRSIYRFEDAGVELTVTFATPLLPDDLDLLSRPFSYVHMAVRSTDGKPHSVQLYLEASAGIACADPGENVVWEEAEVPGGWTTLRAGTWQQNYLSHRGDLTTIDWGYVHLMSGPDAQHRIADASEMRADFVARGAVDGATVVPS